MARTHEVLAGAGIFLDGLRAHRDTVAEFAKVNIHLGSLHHLKRLHAY